MLRWSPGVFMVVTQPPRGCLCSEGSSSGPRGWAASNPQTKGTWGPDRPGGAGVPVPGGLGGAAQP